MTKPTKNTSDFISALRVFVSHGLLDKSEIVDWADKEIARTANPDDYLIELSLIGSRTRNQITDLLNEFIDETRSIMAGRAIIGLLWGRIKDKAIDYKKAFDVLCSIQGQFAFSDIEVNYISHADDGLDLAIKRIWGEQDEVEEEIRGFLECYDGFSFDNVDIWDGLAIETDRKLKYWQTETKDKENNSRKGNK